MRVAIIHQAAGKSDDSILLKAKCGQLVYKSGLAPGSKRGAVRRCKKCEGK